MTRLLAAGVGTLQACVDEAVRAKHTVVVCALCNVVDGLADADTLLLEDYSGTAYDVRAPLDKITMESGKRKTVEIPRPPPGHTEFIGFFKKRDGGHGCAYELAERLLEQPNVAIVIADYSKTGTDMPRLLARIVSWYVGRRNPKLAKALKRRITLPRAEWARAVVKILDSTKTRAGLVERMEEHYLRTLSRLL